MRRRACIRSRRSVRVSVEKWADRHRPDGGVEYRRDPPTPRPAMRVPRAISRTAIWPRPRASWKSRLRNRRHQPRLPPSSAAPRAGPVRRAKRDQPNQLPRSRGRPVRAAAPFCRCDLRRRSTCTRTGQVQGTRFQPPKAVDSKPRSACANPTMMSWFYRRPPPPQVYENIRTIHLNRHWALRIGAEEGVRSEWAERAVAPACPGPQRPDTDTLSASIE